jgi:tetratricopeptide (TPR) repeat protein
MRPLFLASCFFLLGVLPGRADTWVKVKSPHFTVISNGSEKQARQVALGFEQIHNVFTFGLPGLRTDSGAETIVIAPKNLDTFKSLLPFQKNAESIAGEFRKGWEKDHVLVRLDIPDENRNIVYHEYVHKLLHLNFTRLPVWLDEGLAEFFGNTWMRKEGVFIGAPSPRIQLLKSRFSFPLEAILSVTHNSPYYSGGDEEKISMFYAESWGLTHFLMFGDNMGNGQKVNAYLAALQKGLDSQKAFQQVFGDLGPLEKQYTAYVGRFAFRSFRLDNLPKIDADTFTGGAMSTAETDANMGGYFTYVGEPDTASQRLTAALKEDPKSSLAHENSAFLYFRQGKDEEAAKEFDEAAALDPESYLAMYYQAMMKYHGKTDSDSLAQLDAAIEKVVHLNPRFAPALIVRSQIYVHQKKLQEAFNSSVQAQQLEPDRAGYRTNTAAILLLGRNYPAALKLATAIAARWDDSDSAEALAVAAQARRLAKIEQSAEEKTQEDKEMEYSKDTIAVEGIIQSVQCEKSKPMELVLQSGEKASKFHNGKSFGVGFSDTLWYGEDHFNSCHHIEGMNALVRYVHSSGSTDENEMRWLEIRDELIPSSLPASQADKTTNPPAAN